MNNIIQENITNDKIDLNNNVLYTLHTQNTLCFKDIKITLDQASTNLKAENIREGVSILGILGTYTGEEEG